MTHSIDILLHAKEHLTEQKNETEQSIESLLAAGEVLSSRSLAENYCQKLFDKGLGFKGLAFVDSYRGFPSFEAKKWTLLFIIKIGYLKLLEKEWEKLNEKEKKDLSSIIFLELQKNKSSLESEFFFSLAKKFQNEIFFHSNKISNKNVVKFMIDFLISSKEEDTSFLEKLAEHFVVKNVISSFRGDSSQVKEGIKEKPHNSREILEKIYFYKSLKDDEKVHALEATLRQLDPDHPYFRDLQIPISRESFQEYSEVSKQEKNKYLSAYLRSLSLDEVIERAEDYMILLSFINEVETMNELYQRLIKSDSLELEKKLDLAYINLEALIKVDRFNEAINLFWNIYETYPLSKKHEALLLGKYQYCLERLGRIQKSKDISKTIESLKTNNKKKILRFEKE